MINVQLKKVFMNADAEFVEMRVFFQISWLAVSPTPVNLEFLILSSIKAVAPSLFEQKEGRCHFSRP